jgi:hypothetical protein
VAIASLFTLSSKFAHQSASGFFHDSVSPQPLSIPFGPFRIFSKIRVDIRSSRLTTGVVDTGGKWKKSLIRKFFYKFLGHLWQICHQCRRYRWSTLSCEYLRECSKKFETALMVYSGSWGKLIHEKSQKQKISWRCPFNCNESLKVLVVPTAMLLSCKLPSSLAAGLKQAGKSPMATHARTLCYWEQPNANARYPNFCYILHLSF